MKDGNTPLQKEGKMEYCKAGMPAKRVYREPEDPNSQTRFVIAIVNLKGGVAKTTTAGYIAQVLLERGKTVVGFDTDPEHTWLKWARAAPLRYPVYPSTDERLRKDLGPHADFVVIDTPPNSKLDVMAAANLADEVIVPLAATDFDANRLPGTLTALAEAERLRQRALTSVLLTKWNGQLRMASQVKDALEALEVPVLESKIRRLTRYESFSEPTYLHEYEAVLEELEVV